MQGRAAAERCRARARLPAAAQGSRCAPVRPFTARPPRACLRRVGLKGDRADKGVAPVPVEVALHAPVLVLQRLPGLPSTGIGCGGVAALVRLNPQQAKRSVTVLKRPGTPPAMLHTKSLPPSQAGSSEGKRTSASGSAAALARAFQSSFSSVERCGRWRPYSTCGGGQGLGWAPSSCKLCRAAAIEAPSSAADACQQMPASLP